jgi:hypothetical protein
MGTRNFKALDLVSNKEYDIKLLSDDPLDKVKKSSLTHERRIVLYLLEKYLNLNLLDLLNLFDKLSYLININKKLKRDGFCFRSDGSKSTSLFQ